MALIIIIKTNKIAKEYDYENIGLTSEIKSRIIMIIIMMSFNIVIIFLNFFILPKKDKIMKILNESFEIDLLKEEDEKLKEKNKKKWKKKKTKN